MPAVNMLVSVSILSRFSGGNPPSVCIREIRGSTVFRLLRTRAGANQTRIGGQKFHLTTSQGRVNEKP